MNRYHFDLGNSSTGPIGFCGAVYARTPEEAVRILQERLPDELELTRFLMEDNEDGAVEYVDVYLNPRIISAQDIDDVDEDTREGQ